MKSEIHIRPMILPIITGVSSSSWEVDLWIYTSEDIGEVVLETVCSNQDAALKLVNDLEKALKGVLVVREG